MSELQEVIDKSAGLFSRQSGIISPSQLPDHIMVIGAGGIGSWTALLLAKMGVNKITIVDFDDIEDVNIAPQIYAMKDIGQNKAEVLSKFINENMDGDIATPIISKWEEWEEREEYLQENDIDVLIMAVDSMDTRINIWKDVKYAGLGLIVDGRMMKEVLQAFAIPMNDEGIVNEYESKHLYPSSEVEPIACTEKAVAYNQFVIAGVIGTLVKHYAKDDLRTKRVLIDLYSFSTIVQ